MRHGNRPNNLDMDLLRTLVGIADAGGFSKAAQNLCVTQSAVSHQMARLEDQAGVLLFFRNGRTKRLTNAGEQLVSVARQILALNDETLQWLGRNTKSIVSLGLPEYYSGWLLSKLIHQFNIAFPEVQLDVRCGRTDSLRNDVDRGALDLAVILDTPHRADEDTIHKEPLLWLGNPQFGIPRSEPVPLVLFEAPCRVRQCVTQTLDQIGLPWQIRYSGNSLTAIFGAVRAGLGVTALPASCAGASLAPLHSTCLPSLPQLETRFYRAKGPTNALLCTLEGFVRSEIATPPPSYAAYLDSV